MATVVITIRDTDDGIAVTGDFGAGFDPESEAHALAADLTTQLAQGDTQND